MQCNIINEETVKILGINFSHNKKLEEEKSFNNHIAKIENVLRVWRMRDLTIEGKIVIFNFKNCASGFDKDCTYFQGRM